MNQIRLIKGLHFWIRQREYVIQEKMAKGQYKIQDVITETVSLFTEKELVQLFFTDQLEFENSQIESQRVNWERVNFTQIPEPLKAEAKRREKYVKAVLDTTLEESDEALQKLIVEEVAQQLDDNSPPSKVTLYRWLKAYINSGGDLRSLIPKFEHRGNYQPKLHPEVHRIIDEVIKEFYLTPERPKIAQVYDLVITCLDRENNFRRSLGQIPLEIPHRTSIHRLIQKLDPYEKAVGRYGEKFAKLMNGPIGEGIHPTRPLERVEIDHTKLPFLVVDEQTRLIIGTPSLSSAVDKYSGLVIGYYLSFEPFSSLSVMQCLLNAIPPKDYVRTKFPSVNNNWNAYGLMEILVVDNGREFYSEHFQDACQQLGITIQYTPPHMPWYKSSVERTFGSYNTQLLSGQPGTLWQEFSTQYDYDPKKNAVVSLSALQEMLHIFIVDIHNQSSHPQFKCSRTQVWSKAIAEYPPALPKSLQELRVLVGAVLKRTISRKGVEFLGLYYNSPELARLRSNYEKEDNRRKNGKKIAEKATIKYDPTDLSKIYVLDPANHQFIVVPAVSQEYTQELTLWQHRVIKNLAAKESKKVDIVALALAKQKIQEIVEREWRRSHHGRSRKSMARWLGIGRDAINADAVSLPENPIIGPSPSSVKETALVEQIPRLHADTRAGLSNLGSAYSSSVDGEKLQEPNKSRSDGQNLVLATPQQTSKLDGNSQIVTEQQGEESNNHSTEKWLPDLSGWQISISLPP